MARMCDLYNGSNGCGRWEPVVKQDGVRRSWLLRVRRPATMQGRDAGQEQHSWHNCGGIARPRGHSQASEASHIIVADREALS